MDNKRAARYVTSELAFSKGYVRTPGGFRHRSFVHQLKAGEGVSRDSGTPLVVNLASRTLVRAPPTGTPATDLSGMGGGWVTWATWVNPTGNRVKSFSTDWVVPPMPTTESGQLIYLFNGLEDSTGSFILQPVLQWGVSGAGGGPFWSVASWYVDSSNHAFCTPIVPVSPGDRLTGVMTFQDHGDGIFNYLSRFAGIADTSLIAQDLAELVVATETLEVYGLKSATDYPNTRSTKMSNIDLQIAGSPAPLAWSPQTMDSPPFGEHTVVVSNATPGGEVDLFY